MGYDVEVEDENNIKKNFKVMKKSKSYDVFSNLCLALDEMSLR